MLMQETHPWEDQRECNVQLNTESSSALTTTRLDGDIKPYGGGQMSLILNEAKILGICLVSLVELAWLPANKLGVGAPIIHP